MTTYNSKHAAVIAALPGTVPQVMKKAATSGNTVRLWVTRMRAAGECYIKGWCRTGGQLRPRYALGNLQDAPRPARMSQKEYSRRSYLRNRRAAETEVRAAYAEARKNADRMAKTRDPLVGALFGVRLPLNAEG